MEPILAILFFLLILLVMVSISRWIFRINDIIKRLDAILAALKKEGS